MRHPALNTAVEAADGNVLLHRSRAFDRQVWLALHFGSFDCQHSDPCCLVILFPAMTAPIDQTPDDELLSRVRINSPGNMQHDAAKTELEFRHTQRLLEADKSIEAFAESIERSTNSIATFAASTEKSGTRMEFATWVILIATLVQLGLFVLSMSRENRHSAQVSDSGQKVKNVSLDLQEKCAVGAREAFKRDGWEGTEGAMFSNHYDEKLNKCFVQVEHTDIKTSPGTEVVSKVVSDAFEGKVYATYMWRSDKVKKYWEVPPLQCSVMLPSGEDKTCRSSGEFDTLVKQYME